MTSPQTRIASLAALVVVLHGLLLWVGAARLPVAGGPVHAPVMLVRSLPPPAGQADDWPLAPAAVSRPRSRGVPQKTVAPGTLPQAQGEAPVEAAQPGAVAGEPALRVGAIQRAARELSRRRGLAELSDDKLGQRAVDAQAALRAGVASAARSDCLKGGEGGYANSGLGLFALPLLVFDAAAGGCRK